MSFRNFIPEFNDTKWMDQAIAKMGEDAFWKYLNEVYVRLNKLEVGKTFTIVNWVKPENYELFVKIAYYYVSESNCCYQFNSEYTIIKHQFHDINKTAVDKGATAIRNQVHTR